MTSDHNKKEVKRAAALKYDREIDEAPRLAAYGEGDLAVEILRIAREEEIPLYQDQALVEILSKLELGSEIPEEIYQIVAEILAFVYRLSKE